MDYRVSYEHSLKSEPDTFIVLVPSQLIEGVRSDMRCGGSGEPKSGV